MKTPLPCLSAAALALALGACVSTPASPPATATSPVAVQATPTERHAADAFFAHLGTLCGKAYAGRVVVDTPPAANDPFAGKALVMHVRECSDAAIRVPFHVGDDRSRTWVVTRTRSGLRLKHDHRHEDGSEDAVTQYGGDTADAGTPLRQEFPVDADSKATFLRQGLAVSVDNTWAFELVPTRSLTYELARPNGRLFRVEFDLRTPVAAPPPPWGAR